MVKNPTRNRNEPLAQDHVVVAEYKGERVFVHDPGMTLLPDGTFIAAVAPWEREKPRRCGRTSPVSGRVEIHAGTDGGRKWERRAVLPEYTETVPFTHGGRLYMYVQPGPPKGGGRGISFTASDDGGRTWEKAVEVVGTEGRLWNCQPGVMTPDGRLYWAFSDMGPGPDANKILLACCDLERGIMDPRAWRVSEKAEMPLPPELDGKTCPRPYSRRSPMLCLEPNTVVVNGRLRVLARTGIDRQATAGIGAVFEARDDGTKIDFSFRQFQAVPGAQCKFQVVYDEPSGLFWMASNLPADPQNLTGVDLEGLAAHHTLGNDRRFLMLWYACDAHNWFPAGCVARAGNLKQSFMYPSLVVDGEDLCILCRTAHASGDLHDADRATFHRVRDFRSLAMDIRPVL